MSVISIEQIMRQRAERYEMIVEETARRIRRSFEDDVTEEFRKEVLLELADKLDEELA